MLTLRRRHLTTPLAAVLLAGLTSPAAAAPLPYAVDSQASNTSVVAGTLLHVDASPDVTDGTINGDQGQLPLNSTVINGTPTQPSESSHAVADVGLPSNFNGGANGITFSELEVDFSALPGPINHFTFSTTLAGLGIGPGGPLGLPFGVVESPLLVFFASVQTTSLNITLDAPFSSSLTENPLMPGEYLWAGAANVTVSGTFSVSGIPGVDPTESTPFSTPITGLPLAGTFSGDHNGNEIVVGFDPDELAVFLENQDLSTDPVAYDIDVPISSLGLEDLVTEGLLSELQLQGLLLLLGDSISLSLSLQQLLTFDVNTAVHYTNSTPVPEPGTALLLGVGVAILAGARRMR